MSMRYCGAQWLVSLLWSANNSTGPKFTPSTLVSLVLNAHLLMYMYMLCIQCTGCVLPVLLSFTGSSLCPPGPLAVPYSIFWQSPRELGLRGCCLKCTIAWIKWNCTHVHVHLRPQCYTRILKGICMYMSSFLYAPLLECHCVCMLFLPLHEYSIICLHCTSCTR